MSCLPKNFQRTSEPAPGAPPRQIGGVVVAVRHGKSDALCRLRFGHEDFRAGISPDANSNSKFKRPQHASFVARRRNRLPRTARLVIRPRRFPSVNARGFGEKFVDGLCGRSAENMDFKLVLRAAHKRQAHHRVTEVVEFDNDQAGFHRENQRRFNM